MSKTCTKCYFTADDAAAFCPACGTVFADPTPDDGAVTVNAEKASVSPTTERRYAQPVNAGSRSHYAQPIQQHPVTPPQSAPAPAVKEKKRLPYILIGVGAATVIFAVLLIVILSSGGSKLAGKYTWLSGTDGATGSMEIYNDNTAFFTIDSGGSLTITFDTSAKTVSYTTYDGTQVTGAYTFDGDNLTIVSNGYTDKFRKQ